MRRMPTVLIAEPREPVARNLQAACLLWNFQPVVVAGFSEAVRAVEEVLPQIVLSEQNLGDGTASELAWRLKSKVETASIPVVAITEASDVRKEESAEGVLCAEVLERPFSIAELINVLARLAEREDLKIRICP